MKIIKVISKIILASSLILVILGSGFTLFFGGEIETIIRGKLNDVLQNEITPETEIEFSLLTNFPNASVTLFNLQIEDSYKNSKDTLIYAEEIIINLNIFSLLSKDYSFKNIVLKNAMVNILYNEDGIPNFEILKDNEESSEFEIKDMELINCDLSYFDKKKYQSFKSKIDHLKLGINRSPAKSHIALHGELSLYHIIINDITQNKQNSIKITAEMIMHNDSIIINSPYIIIDKTSFEDVKYMFLKNEYSLNMRCDKQEIKDILLLIPDKFQDIVEGQEINGIISATIKVKKERDNLNPYCEIDFDLNNSEYKLLEHPFHLSEITTKGHFTNGKYQNLESCNLTFKEFSSKKKQGFLNGQFEVNNFNQYHLIANMHSGWELSELSSFMNSSPFKNLKGTLESYIKYDGKLSFDKKIKKYINSSVHDARWKFTGVSFNYKESPLNFIIPESIWEIKNNNVFIKDDDFQISESDIRFTGEINNLILYLMNEKEKIDVKGSVFSEEVKFKQLMTIKDINGEDDETNSEKVLPDWFDADIKFHIDKFNYENFNSTNFDGEIEYNGESLKLYGKKMKMSSLEGKISGDAFYYENKIHDLVLKTNIDLDKINVSEGFKSFNNFGQTFITNKNIKGSATSSIYLQAMWDENYNLFSKSLNVNADLKIEKGELIDFEPMYSLSDYVSLDELKNVKFATLENKIRIEKNKVIIPEMDINSTALHVHVSGIHRFNNKINYNVELLLSDLLSKKMKRKSNRLELKDLKHDHSGKTTVQLKMKGTVDNPRIYINKVKLKTDIVEEIIKEGEEIKDIITEEILDNSDPKEDRIDDSGIEIEWEDEK